MMRNDRKTLFTAMLIAAALISLCSVAAAELPLRIVQIDKNGSSSCRRPHNAGVHAKGRSFICWAGPQMEQCVKMYDHKAGQWSKTEVIHTFKSKDYHDYPVIVKGPDDHLHLFWSRHERDLHYCRSPKPLSIQGEWIHKSFPGSRATYPAPMVDSNGDIYVFYRGRGGPGDGHFDYYKSSDNGMNWSQVKDAIANDGKGFYLMHTTHEPAHGDVSERLHLTWFLRRADAHENVYFAYFMPGTDRFASVDGTDLGENISSAEMNHKCLVEKDDSIGWTILSHYQDSGKPLVVYSRNGATVCARWTGREWEKNEVPFGYTEIEKLGPDDFRVYSGGKGVLVWWETEDGGKTWQNAGKAELPVEGFSQCIVIDNHAPTVRLFIKHDDQWNPKTFDGTDLIFIVGEK